MLLFLGGTTNNSTWRDELIPLLNKNHISYFNPIVKDWNLEAIHKENKVKADPLTVELYVISKEMRGVYSIAEAVNASNKKPLNTIFMIIPEGFDEAQIKSLKEVEKLIKGNGAYIAHNYDEIIDIFLQKVKMYTELKDILKLAKTLFTYQQIFDAVGISSILDAKYILTKDLTKEYIDIIMSSLYKFIDKPLYKGIDLNKKEDLKVLKDDANFKMYLDYTFGLIQKKLLPRHYLLLNFFKKYPSGSEISLEDIQRAVKLDKVTIFFILDDLKKNKDIYDYNGREVTLI